MNLMSLVYILGITVSVFIVVLTVEFVPTLPGGKAARILRESSEPSKETISGLRKTIAPLDQPVSRFAPASLLRKAQADLYWSQMAGKWVGWNEVQFVSLRIAGAVGGVLVGWIMLGEPVLALVAGFLGWQLPGMLIGGTARRTRRLFQAQLPEFVQLVSAQMAAGVSLEEALRRTSTAESLVAGWMRSVIQMAQGRTILIQMQKEAERSLMPELISMAVQLEFIRRGAAQQDLLAQMAAAMAAEYVGSAEQRAEKIGAELVIPMVVFYFLPFLASMMVVIGWPIISNLFMK